MRQGMRRTVQFGVLVLTTMLALAPSASAAITPTLALDQTAGKAAGATADLGLDLSFAPTGTDSPDHLALNLPPGLLADASIDGGACLTTADLNDTACQVGTGTVTADAYGSIPITTPVTFDLVPPPSAGDLAGLAVNSSGTQIGATADVKVRPSGDADGVGITIDFVLPNALDGVPVSIAEINSTFDGLRYPATCPATPAKLSVSADSYGDATVHTVTAPLPVTGCAALAYSPAFTVSAARDSADRQVKLSTTITQAATEAPSRSVSLGFPTAVLVPNLGAVKNLCPTINGTCTPVGSATARSPLYPRPLTGQAYLTGSITALSLTLVFPSPFPLTLTGAVNLASNTTAFAGLPDIPLTDLGVTLNAGTYGLFQTPCLPPSGTATATLTDQNGDRTAAVPSGFTVSGCPASGAGPSSGSGAGSGPAGGGGAGSANPPSVSGARSGHGGLSFRITVARHAAKLDALTIELPAGLSFIGHRAGGRLTVAGVTVGGARIRSLSLSHGHLMIVLRRPVSSVTVKIRTTALRQSAALRAKAKANQLKRLGLTVIISSTQAKRTTIPVQINHPQL
jgi:hypothetical protein